MNFFAAGWFQELQRAVGARKLEAGFGVAAVGLVLFGGTLIDAAWSRRNQGVSGGVRMVNGWTVRRRTAGCRQVVPCYGVVACLV